MEKFCFLIYSLVLISLTAYVSCSMQDPLVVQYSYYHCSQDCPVELLRANSLACTTGVGIIEAYIRSVDDTYNMHTDISSGSCNYIYGSSQSDGNTGPCSSSVELSCRRVGGSTVKNGYSKPFISESSFNDIDIVIDPKGIITKITGLTWYLDYNYVKINSGSIVAQSSLLSTDSILPDTLAYFNFVEFPGSQEVSGYYTTPLTDFKERALNTVCNERCVTLRNTQLYGLDNCNSKPLNMTFDIKLYEEIQEYVTPRRVDGKFTEVGHNWDINEIKDYSNGSPSDVEPISYTTIEMTNAIKMLINPMEKVRVNRKEIYCSCDNLAFGCLDSECSWVAKLRYDYSKTINQDSIQKYSCPS